MDFFISRKRPQIVIFNRPQPGHSTNHQNRPRYSLDPGPVMQLPGPPTRLPAHRNLSKDSPYPGASPYEDVSSTRSPSMAHRNERRTRDGERLFDTGSDGFCDPKGFANKENTMLDVMDSLGQVSTTQSNQQGPYSLGWKTLRDYLESPTITIDNVKSKIHGTPHDSIAAWCFGIMSILAFAMMILGGPTSIDRWSASGIILRLVFILGTQPLWKHEASIQAGRDPEDTTKQRAARCFLIESQSPVHRRVLVEPFCLRNHGDPAAGVTQLQS